MSFPTTKQNKDIYRLYIVQNTVAPQVNIFKVFFWRGNNMQRLMWQTATQVKIKFQFLKSVVFNDCMHSTECIIEHICTVQCLYAQIIQQIMAQENNYYLTLPHKRSTRLYDTLLNVNLKWTLTSSQCQHLRDCRTLTLCPCALDSTQDYWICLAFDCLSTFTIL